MDTETTTRFERIEEDVKNLFKRANDTDRWQGKYGEKIENIEKGIEAILDRPQRRWDMVVASAISALIGGGIAVIFAKLF